MARTQRSAPAPRRQQGFTMTELMTTLAVAAVGLSLAVPGFQELRSNSRRASSINALISTLHMARSEAVTRNQQVTVCPSSDGEGCTEGAAWGEGWIAFADPDQDRQVSGAETVLSAGPPVPRLSIASDDFAGFIVYRPSGRVMVDEVDENNGQFTICDERGAGEARVVIINSSGQAALSHLQADGAEPECPDTI